MWPEYSEEAHAHLAEMYVADERFTAYYDQAVEGGTGVSARRHLVLPRPGVKPR